MVNLLPGEPVLHVLCVQIPPAVVIHVILHTGAINLPNEKPASRPEQFRRQAHMVAVQMGCKNIHPVPVHLQLLQLTLHGQTAGGPAKACVNQQAASPGSNSCSNFSADSPPRECPGAKGPPRCNPPYGLSLLFLKISQSQHSKDRPVCPVLPKKYRVRLLCVS